MPTIRSTTGPAVGIDSGTGTATGSEQTDPGRGPRARDVMSRGLVVVDAQDSVLVAWEALSCAGVHHLPVLREGHLAGVVTDRDLAVEWIVGPLGRARRRVGDLVDGPPVRVDPESPLREVAEAMRRARVDAVAVTGPTGRLLGLFTTRDVVAAVAGALRRQPEGREADVEADAGAGGDADRVEAATLFRLVPARMGPRSSTRPHSGPGHRGPAVTPRSEPP